MGFQVFAGALTEAEGDAVKQLASDRLTPILIDITSEAAIDLAAESIAQATNGAGLVGLVNNAGIAITSPLEFLSIAELRRQLEVNVIGLVAVTQKFLPLIRQGEGRIVIIGSITGRLAFPLMGAYCASKFALEGLADVLRMELQPWDISISLIEPGRVATPLWESSLVAVNKTFANFPPQAHTFYAADMNIAIEGIKKNMKAGISPDAVVEAIVHALTAKKPKTRYAIGPDARLAALLARFVSDRVRDRLVLFARRM
jgi:NAD(P)-dependent dehydrogenase (short-subunit alcohol dehydrogenase family)